MRGKGILREDSHLKSSSKKKTANSGKVKGRPGNVVVIDLDDDNVVIIDPAESSKHKYESSHLPREDKNLSSEGIINIDDDEDTDVDPGICVDGDGDDLVSDASSSKSQFPAFRTMWNSMHSDECWVVREKTSAFQFSRCKQTYCTKAPSRNHYGSDPVSDNGSTDSDCSDCELMEDSFLLREQWQRASLGRKHIRKHNSGLEDQASASGSNGEACASAKEENGREQVPVCSGLSDADCGKENVSEFFTNEGGNAKTTSFKPPLHVSFMDANQKGEQQSFPFWKPGLVQEEGGNAETPPFKPPSHVSFMHANKNGEQESFPFWKPAPVQEKESLHRNEDFQFEGGTAAGEPRCGHNYHSNKDTFDGFDGFSGCEDEEEISPQGSFQPGGGSVTEDPNCCNKCKSYENVCDGIPAFWKKKEPSPQESPHMWFEQRAGEKQNMHPKTSSKGKEKIDSGQSFVLNSRLFDEVKVDKGVPVPDEKFSDGLEGFLFCRPSAEGKSEGCSGKASYQDRVIADSNKPSICNTASNRTSIDHVVSSGVQANEPNDKRGPLDAQAGSVLPSVEGDLINEREKLKDTDEYKKAIEEEWASRQRELQIQSEEAQRLRKRRKAETMRLCDIERRQKQRIEEVRKTQKKDEENINLKEKLRGEIRQEIKRLEITCIDMASLLRGLGIHVAGGIHPMSHDVHAAYKRALLKFHPDRASKTDIRQQVEAEEKFKLISRMKEKFLSTSCY